MANYQEVIKKYKNELLKCDHVVGVGFGIKERGGEKTGEEAVVVLVDQKLPHRKLKKKNIVPQAVGGIKTDIIEVGEIHFFNERQSRVRPAQPGVSIGHYKITAGTLGAIVKDRRTGNPMILSNNHVLANITNGHDDRSHVGDPILQPGSYDNGSNPDDVIAHLERFIPIKKGSGTSDCKVAIATEKILNYFVHLLRPYYNIKVTKNEGSNLVDCALARPKSTKDIRYEILGIGKINGVREAEVDLPIQKSGRTTGLTEGKIVAIGTTVSVNMSESEVATFDDQFVTTPISQAGDSGSLVLDMQNNAIGLLFAGSEKATICNRIQNVLEQLQIDL